MKSALILSIAHKSDAPWNETAWKNERFDQLLLEGRGELDQARREEIYCEIQRLLSDEGGALIPVFMDRHLNLDAEGEVHRDGLFRGLAFAVPAKAEGSDETVYFVTRVYLPDDGINPYKNTLPATVSREASLSGSDVAPGTGRESWTVEDGSGGRISFTMEYRGAVPSRSEREAKIYSNVEPDFYRVYRYEQLVDLVRSGPAEIDRVDDYAFSVSIEELAPFFDGSEELIGILRLPWYSRRTFLP